MFLAATFRPSDAYCFHIDKKERTANLIDLVSLSLIVIDVLRFHGGSFNPLKRSSWLLAALRHPDLLRKPLSRSFPATGSNSPDPPLSSFPRDWKCTEDTFQSLQRTTSDTCAIVDTHRVHDCFSGAFGPCPTAATGGRACSIRLPARCPSRASLKSGKSSGRTRETSLSHENS